MSGKYCMDANIFIESWRSRYPIERFPSLWDALSNHRNKITIIKPIHDEIEPTSSTNLTTVRTWLASNNFLPEEIDSETKNLSIALEKSYQIKTSSRGAGENDMMLIAYAKQHDKTVVTYESLQAVEPKESYNFKIPLICKKEGVSCINFIGFLSECNIAV